VGVIDDYVMDMGFNGMGDNLLDEVDDPLDMVLDDRTAKLYNLDTPVMGDNSFHGKMGERLVLDDDDDDLIADEIGDLVIEEEDDDLEEDDDDFEDE
jgi:DNA-directed RNA polymerase subunit beta'